MGRRLTFKTVKLCSIAVAATTVAACAATPRAPVPARSTPFADHHQHLVSPAFAPIAKLPERDASALLTQLDAAGIDRAIVLSVAYSFADDRKNLPDPDALSRAENDWTSAQVALGKGRLTGFCSANPLREAALAEIERCLQLPAMRGIKLHVGNSGLSFRNAEHIARLAPWFALAQRRGVPILIHMRPRGGGDYGAVDVPVFLDQLVAKAADVPIIVAHLGASSPGYSVQNDEIMKAFAAASRSGSPHMRNVYFDVSANVDPDSSAGEAEAVAKRMREIGVAKFLYGSDLSAPGGFIAEGWRIFRTKVPLTDAEWQVIASNRVSFPD